MPTGLPGARLGSPLTGEFFSSSPGAIAWPPRTSLKYSIGTALPSTSSRKSPGRRPVTRFPCLSVTTASTLTTRTSICSPNTLCGAGGGRLLGRGRQERDEQGGDGQASRNGTLS